MPILSSPSACVLAVGERELTALRDVRFSFTTPSPFVERSRAKPDIVFGANGGGFSASVSFPISREDYARFVAPFQREQPPARRERPRWGQPGRNRRRKARLAVRRAAGHR